MSVPYLWVLVLHLHSFPPSSPIFLSLRFPTYPTDPFPNFKLPNPSHDVSELNKTRQPPDLEAFEIVKERVGFGVSREKEERLTFSRCRCLSIAVPRDHHHLFRAFVPSNIYYERRRRGKEEKEEK